MGRGDMARIYRQKVDRTQIPVCKILGVDIAAIDMDWLLDFTDRYIKDLSGDYLCVSNVHTTVMAYENEEYCAIQNGGIMAIPDGGPLSSVGRKRGYVHMERITGPDYMARVLEISVKKGYSHYFYGSTEKTLEGIRRYLDKDYPGLKIAGMYSPPFRMMTEDEDSTLINEINGAGPDFIWVGLGAPKQERWMADHQGRVHGLMVGVGAGFDYLAGNIGRAPTWMQRLNLEWLYRFFQDPRRLYKRYLHANMRFIWEVVIKGR